MARGIAGPVGSLACNAERRECVLECEGEIDGPVPFTAAVRLRTRSARYGWNDVSHVSVLNNVGRDCMLERERERNESNGGEAEPTYLVSKCGVSTAFQGGSTRDLRAESAIETAKGSRRLFLPRIVMFKGHVAARESTNIGVRSSRNL